MPDHAPGSVADRSALLRGQLSGARSETRSGRRLAQSQAANVLVAATLHAAARRERGMELTGLEQRLTDQLAALFGEEQVAEFGRTYQEPASRAGITSLFPDVVAERYTVDVFSFEPGDTLLLYTDGVIEARDGDGGFYPFERRAAQWTEASPASLLHHIRSDLLTHADGRLDDAALIALHRTTAAHRGRRPGRIIHADGSGIALILIRDQVFQWHPAISARSAMVACRGAEARK